MEHYIHQPADRPIGKNQKQDRVKQTTEDWMCQWKYNGRYRKLFVPQGYIYDGASVPRVFWSIAGIRPDGLIRAASLAHDVLYRAAGGDKPDAWAGCSLVDETGRKRRVSRKEADWVLKQFMRYAGMSRLKCFRAHYVVRAFGGRHWGGKMPDFT